MPGIVPTDSRAFADGGRWDGLRTLIGARLLVATLALPAGVLLRPEVSVRAWPVLWWSLLVVGLVSALFWLGLRIRRGVVFQTYLHMTADLLLVSSVAAMTGGRDSQFVLFYALVVVTGGVLAQLAGGLYSAAGACAAYLSLPAAERWLGADSLNLPSSGLPPPGLLVGFLCIVGVLTGILGARVQRTRDDLVRAERELDRVRVDNDAILNHLTTGVLTVDQEGKVAYMNPAAEQVLELRANAVCGRVLAEALPERVQPFSESVRGTLEKRRPRLREELKLKTGSGRELPVGISTSLLMHQGEVTGVVAVFQDLTEVREMERRARRNQTLAEVGALAAGVAHELRNGLNPISGSVECLQRELKLEGENAVLMELIATESARLNRFVTDLLSYSRERELAVEPVGLDEHLAELCETLSRDPRCGAGVAVRYEAGDVPAELKLDRNQIRQVWLNLASNAFEAMPNGGSLTVRWRLGEGNQAIVEFADSGPGIAARDLARIGEPFFTTKQGGTGLGLAIAQRIVERHGGTLALECAPGQGTVARVSLPGVQISAAQAA